MNEKLKKFLNKRMETEADEIIEQAEQNRKLREEEAPEYMDERIRKSIEEYEKKKH